MTEMSKFGKLVAARIYLRLCQDFLHMARIAHRRDFAIIAENLVKGALDALWEAQQHAQG